MARLDPSQSVNVWDYYTRGDTQARVAILKAMKKSLRRYEMKHNVTLSEAEITDNWVPYRAKMLLQSYATIIEIRERNNGTP